MVALGKFKTATSEQTSRNCMSSAIWKISLKKCLCVRFKPWSGKIPHAVEQLSPCATTTEPTCLEPVLHNKRSHCNEKPAHHNEE